MPKNPISNGLSESAVKRAKSLLEKCDRNWKHFQKALYKFNNVPLQYCKHSPAQLFFFRRQRGAIPCLKELLTLDPLTKLTEAEKHHKERVRIQLRKACQGIALKPLEIGQRVVMQSNIDSKSKRSCWNIFRVIIAKRRTGSYTVNLDTGGQMV